MAEYTGPFQHKRGTTTEWAASVVPLRDGELGIDTDLRRMKLGDGATLFPDLPWVTPDSATIEQLQALAEAVEGAVTPTDAVMAGVAATPGSAFATQLTDTIGDVVEADIAAPEGAIPDAIKALAPKGSNRFVMIDSSIGNQARGGKQSLDVPVGEAVCSSQFWWTDAFLGGALTLVKNASVSGDTYAGMRARFVADVLSVESEWVWIGSPTNSILEPGPTFAQIAADLDQMIAWTLDAGRRVVLVNTMARHVIDTASERQKMLRMNAYMARLRDAVPGIVLIDAYSATVDPLTGLDIDDGRLYDRTHPAPAGAARIGLIAADALRPHLAPATPRVMTNVDYDSILVNPAFENNGTGWDLLTTGTSTVTPDYSQVADDGFGHKAVVAINSTGATNKFSDVLGIMDTRATSSISAVGRVIQASLRLRWSDLVPVTPDGSTGSGCKPVMQLLCRASNGTVVAEAQALFHPVAYRALRWDAMPTSGEIVMTTSRITVPANATDIRLVIGWQGAASVTLEVERMAPWMEIPI